MGIDKKSLEEFLKKESEQEVAPHLRNLAQISDMDKLISYWENTLLGSEPEKLIEARMAEVLKEQLPQISDMDKLISYWENTSSGSEPRKLIEARMAEVLKEVSLDNTPDWFEKMLKRKKDIPQILKKQFTSKVKELLG